MIKELIKLANDLDVKGFTKEADKVDSLIQTLKDAYGDDMPESVKLLIDKAQGRVHGYKALGESRNTVLDAAKTHGDLLMEKIKNTMELQEDKNNPDLWPIAQLAQQVTDALYKL